MLWCGMRVVSKRQRDGERTPPEAIRALAECSCRSRIFLMFRMCGFFLAMCGVWSELQIWSEEAPPPLL